MVLDDPVLKAGPGEILRQGERGFSSLVDVLKWLPELNLALGFGHGEMNVQAVARVVRKWIEGEPIYKLAQEFPGNDDQARIRHAGKYIYGTVSQTISWGAHAYLKGWIISRPSKETGFEEEDIMLPTYIQYGVKTPEASVVSLLGVPRQFAESFASEYRGQYGRLKPETASNLKKFVINADKKVWSQAVSRSSTSTNVDPSDLRYVWRQMQGLNP